MTKKKAKLGKLQFTLGETYDGGYLADDNVDPLDRIKEAINYTKILPQDDEYGVRYPYQVWITSSSKVRGTQWAMENEMRTGTYMNRVNIRVGSSRWGPMLHTRSVTITKGLTFDLDKLVAKINECKAWGRNWAKGEEKRRDAYARARKAKTDEWLALRGALRQAWPGSGVDGYDGRSHSLVWSERLDVWRLEIRTPSAADALRIMELVNALDAQREAKKPVTYGDV